jgi:hypothetical protein
LSGEARRRRPAAAARDARDPIADERRVIAALARLAALLGRIGHPRADEVAALHARFGDDPAAAWKTLNSNAWWAGAGSLAAETMADNPGLDPHHWQAEVREFRELMIDIAEVLRARGEPNPGLGSWLLAFRSWNDSAV